MDPEVPIEEVEDACGPTSVGMLGLRIGGIFILFSTSLVGAIFPIAANRISVLQRTLPSGLFEFTKFFGSGVILATGFIHLLEPATDALGEGNTRSGGGCINDSWGEYPYAFGICLVSLYFTFIIQIMSYRLGIRYMEKRGIRNQDRHAHVTGHPHAKEEDMPHSATHSHNHEPLTSASSSGSIDHKMTDVSESEVSHVFAQMIGIAMLELGVVFHSFIIGLTLAVTEDTEFKILFIVIIFHQMFEGLGLGTRLAFLQLQSQYGWIPWTGATIYSLVTPIGLAIGLGLREGLAMSGATASVASGVLDATSAGILIYTALVELMAHEFIFNPEFQRCSMRKLVFSLSCFACGAALMALLGKWA